jgi:hypothetical protein
MSKNKSKKTSDDMAAVFSPGNNVSSGILSIGKPSTKIRKTKPCV